MRGQIMKINSRWRPSVIAHSVLNSYQILQKESPVITTEIPLLQHPHLDLVSYIT